MKGKVKFYNRKQDFCFVIGADGTEYYFNALSITPLKEKDAVEFNIEDSSRGKVARQVRRASASSPKAWLLLLVGLLAGVAIGYMVH